MPLLVEYKTVEIQATALAALVAGQLAEAVAARGKATLAVPGGTTPGAFLGALSCAKIDWARVSVLLTDERLVPETSARSNTRLLRTTLLQGPAAAATLVPIFAGAGTPEDAAEHASLAVARVLPLDVCVLGMGADLHIASLFPGADRVDEALDPECPHVLLPMRAPGATEPRISLTGPVIAKSRHVHLLIRGQEKLAALTRAETPGPLAEAPVRLVLQRPDTRIHYCESEGSNAT